MMNYWLLSLKKAQKDFCMNYHPIFFDELEAFDKMDKVLSKEEEQKLIELEKSSNSVTIDKQTKTWVRKFRKIYRKMERFKLKSRDLSTFLRLFQKESLIFIFEYFMHN